MHKMQKIFLYILLCCEIPLVADAEASATRGRSKRAFRLFYFKRLEQSISQVVFAHTRVLPQIGQVV